jgi:hypothetical protein
MKTDNLYFYLQNRLIQTSQAGGQRFSDTSPFSIPWPKYQILTFLPSPTFPLDTTVEWFDFFDEALEQVLDGDVWLLRMTRSTGPPAPFVETAWGRCYKLLYFRNL